MSRWSWIITEMASRLWMRAALYGVAGLGTALAAIYLKRFIPVELTQKIGADAVDGILNIMAASMLSVTIFSLSTMVSAYGAATSNVTPRATKLLIEDRISHNALSTFIGAFIFSIVGIVALKTGAYGDTGRFILFIVTAGVIVMVIVALLSWIEYLQRLGRVGHTIARVEDAATRALSSAINDSGTPIQIIGIGVRIFSLWAKRAELAGSDTDVRYPRLYVPVLNIDDLFDDFFTPVARDGAGLLEVMILLQKGFIALAGTGDADLIRAARHHARLSLKRSDGALALEDRERLAAVAAPLLA